MMQVVSRRFRANAGSWRAFVQALLVVWGCSPWLALGQGLQSNHGVLRAVPVRAPVTVDGKLDEWDVSAEIFSYGVRRLRERYSVRAAAMWDAEAVYLGLKWRDPTPMINNVDVDAAPGDGWMADSFQGRFIVAGRQVHLTTCYSSKKDKTAAVIEYDAALNQAGRRVFISPGKATKDPSGFAQAFVADSDSRGYVQELRIPWTLLGKDFKPAAGAKIGFTGEYFWGNASGTTWPAVMWSDPINPKNPVRVVVYQNPGVWGEMELLGQGNLARPVDVDDELRLVGTTPIRFDVPADATHFSLVIDDASGRRVRNLASHLRVEDYVVDRHRMGQGREGAKPNGPSSGKSSDSAATKTIEVPWDVRPDGSWKPDRLLFLDEQMAAAGTYTARCIVHRGIGVTYAGSFYNPGTPPWPTANGTGGWGFDHTGPGAVAAMPKEAKTKGRVFLGWHHGECGVGFIGLDADGRKIWEWLRRGVGATQIATNSQAVFFCFEEGGKSALGKVHPDNGEQLKFGNGVLDIVLPGPPTGLAARGANVLVAIASANKVLWLNGDTGALQHEFSVAGAGSTTFVGDDQFVAISGDQLLAGELSRRTATPFSFNVTGKQLVGARMPLAFGAGKLLYGDSTDSTVKVLSAADKRGQVETIIGEPGGHQPGAWKSRRMNAPRAIAAEELASGGVHVWVVEEGLSPRRVSVWDAASGQLVRDYLGNTRYSASGGFLSDDIPGIGFVDGVKYQLDLTAGTYSPLEVLGGMPAPVKGEHNGFTLGRGAGNFANPYHFLSSASGREREYIVEAGGTQPMVFMKRGERWQCVAALGSAQQEFPAGLTKAPSPTAVFAWHDANGDGHQQSSEIVWHDFGAKQVFQCGWGYRCGRDLVFYHSGLAFRPVRFTSEGAPVYDVTKAERLPGELGQVKGDIHKTKFGYVADTSTGEVVDKLNVVHGLHFVTGFNESGQLVWKYPNYWVSVHGAFTAPMAMPGVLMGVLKTSGIIEAGNAGAGEAKATGNAHDIISLRGNIGQEFLIRDDGLYLAELFTDQRMAPADLPPTRDIVGAPINETTLGGEPFNGWIGRQRDGKVRMTYGLTDVRIAEVVGLDRITELPSQSIVIGEKELAAARAFQPKPALARVTDAIIPRGDAFTDAELAEKECFADAQDVLVIRSGREEVGRARLRWDESGLHLACQVADATPLVNKGTSGPLAFKSGDSVSLFASALDAATPERLAGTRVLLASLKGKPTAMVYRPAGPGNSAYVFESPVRKTTFAHVAESEGIRFVAQAGGGGYSLRCTIPWAELAIQPVKNLKIRGDIGLLFGDDIGASTAQRVHWVDRETNVVNDSPTEAEFFPARWGTWTLLDSSVRTANAPAAPTQRQTSPKEERALSAADPPRQSPKFRWISVKSIPADRSSKTATPDGGASAAGPERKIEMRFALDASGYVTLAIENSEGVRVRNLVGETRFDAGEHLVTWDGRDEACKNFRICGVYDIDPQTAPAGKYRVRGLVRPEIEARYELTVNNAGNPPWPKQDGTGRWLADHSPPSDVLFLPPGRAVHRGSVHDAGFRPGDAEFIPTDEPLLLIASHVAESGDGLAWCDLDGKKRRGVRSLGAGGGWCGAERLARDAGPQADASVYAYLATGWKNSFELRTLPAGEVIHSTPVNAPGDLHCLGLAVHNRLLAATLSPVQPRGDDRKTSNAEGEKSAIQPNGMLLLFDTVARKPLSELPLVDVGGVAFDDQGRLFVVTNKQIVRFDGLDRAKNMQLAEASAVKLMGHPALSAPRQILWNGGELFVADHGTAHQVHVLNAQGAWLRTIGRAGGATLGTYHQDAMQNPAGMTIDSRGRLWVAESDYSPKRVSVWQRDGRFERAFYGPPGYGGGGSLDSLDPTRFYLAYGSGLEFQIDWKTRTSKPVHRYWIDDPATLRLGGDWHAAPQTPIVVDGRRYMTNAFSSSPGGFGNVVGVWRFENGLAVPAAAAGAFSAWPPLSAAEFQSLVPDRSQQGKTFFVWSDLNGDQRPQPNEIATAVDDGIQRNNGKHVGGVYVGPDLALTTAFGLHLKPSRFTEQGVPVYEGSQVQRLVRQLEFHWVPYDAVYSSEGWFITKAEPLRGFKNGKQMWSYPNQWPELHACLREPPPLPKPGQFIGTMRWLGHPVTPRGGDVGEIFALTGYYGQICLITADGLCVGTLFQDARATGYFNAFEKLADAQTGLLMNGASLQTECFFDTITQASDGRIYLQAGKSQCNIVRLDGLDAIRRVPSLEFAID